MTSALNQSCIPHPRTKDYHLNKLCHPLRISNLFLQASVALLNFLEELFFKFYNSMHKTLNCYALKSNTFINIILITKNKTNHKNTTSSITILSFLTHYFLYKKHSDHLSVKDRVPLNMKAQPLISKLSITEQRLRKCLLRLVPSKYVMSKGTFLQAAWNLRWTPDRQ